MKDQIKKKELALARGWELGVLATGRNLRPVRHTFLGLMGTELGAGAERLGERRAAFALSRTHRSL
jgi:hypothetical protein